MKKLLMTIFAMFLGVMLFAQSYTVIRVVGANGGPGIAKMNNIGSIAVGQELVDTDTIELRRGNYILLDNGLAIYTSGKVKDVVEKKKLRKVETVKSTIGEAVEKSSKPVATAASRASDAKEDLDWAE